MNFPDQGDADRATAGEHLVAGCDAVPGCPLAEPIRSKTRAKRRPRFALNDNSKKTKKTVGSSKADKNQCVSTTGLPIQVLPCEHELAQTTVIAPQQSSNGARRMVCAVRKRIVVDDEN